MLCVIIGAGYSYVSGYPLAHQLFDRLPIATSLGSARRFEAVYQDFQAWRDINSDRGVEEYLLDLYKASPLRFGVTFSEAASFISASFASPRQRSVFDPRYATRIESPSHCKMHNEFWQMIVSTIGIDFGIVTTNY